MTDPTLPSKNTSTRRTKRDSPPDSPPAPDNQSSPVIPSPVTAQTPSEDHSKDPNKDHSEEQSRHEAVKRLLVNQGGRTVDPSPQVAPMSGLKPGTGPTANTANTVRVRVLKNMTYLDGNFHAAGAVVTVSRIEAEAAVRDGAATGTATGEG